MATVILGIETSCDETAAAVYDDTGLRSNVVASQLGAHEIFGGVVPELASRMHLEAICPVIDTALAEAELEPGELTAVAVTRGPGLVGSLLVGVGAAKGLAWSLGLPLLGINHLEGHVYSNFIEPPMPAFPMLCLIASGGHSDLLLVTGHGSYEVLGRARDDAAGEAFDKVARVLGLEYPGGPKLDKLAEDGDPKAYPLPRAWLEGKPEFSFSGLKTAVSRLLADLGELDDRMLVDVCASFRAAVVDVLVTKTFQAAEAHGVKHVAICGGVAASRGLRRQVQAEGEARGITISTPPLKFCTDNAAMIACAGYHRWRLGGPDALDLEVSSNRPLPQPGEWAGVELTR